MRAIEINATTDIQGHLKLNIPIHLKNQNVRVIILVDDDSEEDAEDKLWLKAAASNPAFESLNDPEENIYSLLDGVPIDYKK